MENANIKDYSIGVSCNEKHIALFCLEDLSKNKEKFEKEGFQCICIECGKFASSKNQTNIIYSNKKQEETFIEYYKARSTYLHYMGQGFTPEEAVSAINEEYASNDNKVLRKRNNETM